MHTEEEVDRRLDELAGEIQERYANSRRLNARMAGLPEDQVPEVAFGLDTGVVGHYLLMAAQAVEQGEARLPSSMLVLACLWPAQDSALIAKCAGYPRKWGLGAAIAAKVGELLEADGKHERAVELCRAWQRAEGEEKEQAHARLLKHLEPYRRRAIAGIREDLEIYDPFK